MNNSADESKQKPLSIRIWTVQQWQRIYRRGKQRGRNNSNSNPIKALVVVCTVSLVLLTTGLVVSLLIWMYQHSQCTSRELGVEWIESPSHSMHRPCPKPLYTTQLSTSQNNNNNTSITTPKICITSLTDHVSTFSWQRFVRCRDFDALDELTWPNRLAYAKQHSYRFLDGSKWLDSSRPPAWSKIRAVQAAFGYLDDHDETTNRSNSCDWVFWMDADTVIMNHSIRLESLLPVDESIHLIATYDRRFTVNSGAWLIRRSAWSRQFLVDWWEMKSWVRRAGLSLSGDNAAFGHLVQQRMKSDHQNAVQIPARCNFNSFGAFVTKDSDIKNEQWIKQQEWYMSDKFYHAGDFVAHASGIDQKAAGVQLLLQRADR